MVKSLRGVAIERRPGEMEYLVVKDTACGPDACQWNLDVLSRRPRRLSNRHVWFPGHRGKGFEMGMDLFALEPAVPRIELEKGLVNKELRSVASRRRTKPGHVKWTVNEHWLAHVPAGAGATSASVVDVRRRDHDRLCHTDHEHGLGVSIQSTGDSTVTAVRRLWISSQTL